MRMLKHAIRTYLGIAIVLTSVACGGLDRGPEKDIGLEGSLYWTFQDAPDRRSRDEPDPEKEFLKMTGPEGWKARKFQLGYSDFQQASSYRAREFTEACFEQIDTYFKETRRDLMFFDEETLFLFKFQTGETAFVVEANYLALDNAESQAWLIGLEDGCHLAQVVPTQPLVQIHFETNNGQPPPHRSIIAGLDYPRVVKVMGNAEHSRISVLQSEAFGKGTLRFGSSSAGCDVADKLERNRSKRLGQSLEFYCPHDYAVLEVENAVRIESDMDFSSNFSGDREEWSLTRSNFQIGNPDADGREFWRKINSVKLYNSQTRYTFHAHQIFPKGVMVWQPNTDK